MFQQMTVYDEQYSSYVPQEIQHYSSSIHYAPNYRHLQQQQNQYFLLKSIKVQPQQRKMHLTLYENMDTLGSNQPSYNKKMKNQGVKKICDFTYSKQRQIKIPRTKNDIEIEILNEFGDHFFGTFQINYHQQEQMALYNKNGDKKGNMSYQISQITSKIKQNLSSEHYSSSQFYNNLHADCQENSILLKRYGNESNNQQFRTIQEEESFEQQRTKTLSRKINEQVQSGNNKSSQLLIKRKKQSKEGDQRIQTKNVKDDAVVKLEKMENIKSLIAMNSNQEKGKYSRHTQYSIRRPGHIKAFKKHKKIYPSSIFISEAQIQKLPEKIDKKQTIQFNFKDKLNLISKNFSIKVQNKEETPKILDLYVNYRKNHGKPELQTQTQADQTFMNLDLVFTNISVTLYNKIYGKKHLMLILQPFSYTTQPLYGNHLLWIGKGYNFRNILSFNELTVIIKITTDYGQQQTMVKTSIPVSAILQDQNKSFHQSYLFNSKKQKIGVIILGFQVNKKDQIYNKHQPIDQLLKLRLKNKSFQNNTSKINKQFKSDKATFLHNSIIYQYLPRHNNKVISLRSLTSQSRKKYQGGKNIKLSKANRFLEHKQKSPGPGQYTVDSIFKRYK